jgi:transcription initiation factor TFIID subunit TAF12
MRKYTNLSDANIQKICREMLKRVEQYAESRQQEKQVQQEQDELKALRREILKGLVVPPAMSVHIVQETDAWTGDKSSRFSLEFKTYGTPSLRDMRFNREQLGAICAGFRKALGLDTAYVIRVEPEIAGVDNKGPKPRTYRGVGCTMTTRYVSEAHIYATEIEANNALKELPDAYLTNAKVVRYADEFLSDPTGQLLDAWVRG